MTLVNGHTVILKCFHVLAVGLIIMAGWLHEIVPWRSSVEERAQSQVMYQYQGASLAEVRWVAGVRVISTNGVKSKYAIYCLLYL